MIDDSKYLNRLVEVESEKQTCVVEPGIVLDHLNSKIKHTGLWYPVDVSTSSRATLGGMTGNNSCGSRSIRYGTMRDNVRVVQALLADGNTVSWRTLSKQEQAPVADLRTRNDLLGKLLYLGGQHTN